MAFKSLESTFVYRHLNSANGVSTGIMKALNDGTILKRENLEEAFLSITKNFKFPMKHKVMEAFDRNEILLVFSPPNTRIPTCLPFFLTKNAQGKVVAVVIVDMYGTMDPETKSVKIDAKKLYCMMEAAEFARIYFHHNLEISKRNVVITNGSAVYCNMFARVLNKKYALNVDKLKLHKVLFLASKFYMINILGMADNEMTTNYALKNCPNGNPIVLKELNEGMRPEDYTDLSTFIQALTRPEQNIGIGDLTVRGYLETFINMYDGSALFALEYFPYFFYTILCVTNGAYINNQYALEQIVDNNGSKIYADLFYFNR